MITPRITLIALALTIASTGAIAQSSYKSKLSVKPPKGVTVAGVVECDGKPVAGVKVSDGYNIVKTDKKGAYYLKSKKENPQVFISAPSGYDVWRSGVVPEFWADFTKPAGEFERHDFRLKKVDNSKHAIMYITDVHLANERNDVDIFKNEYIETLRKEAKKLESQGIPVYSINLGDASWDMYWYGHNFTITDFRDLVEDAKYPTALYSVMGNHDNDGGVPVGPNVDMESSMKYQKSFGPRYYSFDLGGVHYVMLDNIHYKNEPLKEPCEYPGIAGKRNYVEDFTPEQLNWLRKDLADVSYDTPIVLNYHGPVLKEIGAERKYKIRTDKKSTQELLDIVKPYKEVHAFSGHSHNQRTCRFPDGEQSFIDHNIAGTSGSWWRNRAVSYANLCPNGSPVAWELVMVDGKDIKWDHRPFEYPADKQFFAWDMNRVKDYFKTNREARAFLTMHPKWTDYSELPENAVFIDVFSYDPKGNLKVTENGKELKVEKILKENPLYTVAYMIPNTIWINAVKEGYQDPRRFHLFQVNAQTADAPLEITWTDPFGREFKETLKRPADFNIKDYSHR